MPNFRMICDVSLGHKYELVSDDCTTASVPEFELFILLHENFCGSSEHSRFVMKRQKLLSHVSTIPEFLSVVQSSASCEALMSSMLFPNTDLLSRMYLGPSVLHYAEANAREVLRHGRVATLMVEAIVVYEFVEGTDLVPPSLDIFYQPISTKLMLFSHLDMIQWGIGDDQCAVCLEEFGPDKTIARTECCHVFHRHCIVKWLMEKGNCPLCRYCKVAENPQSY